MPWRELKPMDLKVMFIADYLSGRPISFECTQLNCGSGLAREGDLPADRNLADALDPCGSGLAREGGLPTSINARCAGLFAGKPAPTGLVSFE